MNKSLFYNGVVRYALKLMKYTSLACFVVCLMCFTAIAGTTYGQKFLEAPVSIKLNNTRLTDALDKIAADKQVRFAYTDNVLKQTYRVTLTATDKSIKDLLGEMLSPFNLTYKIIGDVIVISEGGATTITGNPVDQKQVKITGTVTDDLNLPLPGVTVKVKGTTIAVSTDANGVYTIDAPADAVLVFSFIGFTTKEVAVNGQSSLNVQLVAERTTLNEVVVVGYGTQKRSSVVGAIDQVGSTIYEGRPAVNALQALQGTMPSLIIQQRSLEPGQAPNVNIRGVSTIGNNTPLLVIDGIIYEDFNAINNLNPSDIETSTVLKDAGAAAIYGSRSANGVLLITTKKGKKNTKATINYNGLVGIQKPEVTYQPVHSYENALLRNEANVNAGLQPIYSPQQIRDMQAEGDHEWFLDAILKNAWQQNHNLSVTGGSEKTTYLVSAGLVDQRNNLVGPDFGARRYNFRINLTNEIGKLKVTSILAYNRTDRKEHSFNTSTLIVDAARTPTYYDIKDANGNYLTNDVLAEFNPLGILEQGGYRQADDDGINANISAELNITSDFKLRGVLGGTLVSNHTLERVKQVNFLPKGTYGADRNTNDINYKSLFINTQLIAEYNKTFNKKHNVGALLGVANESLTTRGNEIRYRLTDPELGTPTTGTIIDPNTSRGTLNSDNTTERSLNSAFGRVTYDYDNKYYGEFNFRIDASSKFNKQNRNAFFPSISAGYRISNEDFMEDYRSKYGDLKIRGSYGILGNQNVDDYNYQTRFQNAANVYGFNNSVVSGINIAFANPDLRWERGATLNIGVDAGFLKNSLTVSADYFNKTTRDILLVPQVPGAYGAGVPLYNAGEVRNQGWELNVNYRITSKNFRHTINFNVGDSKNKVLKLEGDQEIFSYDEMQVIRKVGLPLNSYVGYKRDGYFQNLDEVNNGPKPTGLNVVPGDNRYIDVNKDGVIDENDKFVLGNPFPRYNYGLTYNLGYKQFDFTLFLQGVGQRSMFVRGELVEPFHFNYGQVVYQHQLDYWTPQNPDARYPRLAANGSQSNTNNFRRGSDMYLYNGAYMRVKNIQIGYTLPTSIAKKIGMQKVRAYVSGQNLFTISSIDFLDPEASEFNNNLGAGGANSGRNYPVPVYYGFGLDISL
ncbi:SusC/RagA family TonB-linked outer membrane protein [Mucilaginibacter limnophilus]|uniref:SusC/RagA family TonB-linked outer membrane protein n=1 Tax=Mucilaginibacter limnophilus TaxID=1932778 RepID=A0A437MZE3_9SPHI|nr:TonB-dependent receptor [Mucilaginibacter limnophilus]RVU03027.1 SusC/RagA family TonB-linked outer membrane protein [Mucilaginibacter limnophilus]